MTPDNPTSDLRAVALAVAAFSALTAALLLAQVAVTSSAGMARYGIDETTRTAEGHGR